METVAESSIEKDSYVARDNQKHVVIMGLHKLEATVEEDPKFTLELDLDEETTLDNLWNIIKDHGYKFPFELRHDDTKLNRTSRRLQRRSHKRIKVTSGPSTENEINIDETLLSHANAYHGMTAEYTIVDERGDDPKRSLKFIKNNRGFRMSFQRTPRMPDDNRLHQLPGTLGAYDLFSVDAYADVLPKHITDAGGVFFPMWQREAMWIDFDMDFSPWIPRFAVRVFVGKVNAISGLLMDEDPGSKQDYIVVPGQEWLDGICVAPGVVRQFVAMPLGSGYTVEGQKTKEEKHGGLQIEIIPEYQKSLRWWYGDLDPPITQDLLGQAIIETQGTDLQERMTPTEHGLKVGEVIRSYDPSVYYTEPYRIKHFIGDRVEVVFDAKYMNFGLRPNANINLDGKYGAQQPQKRNTHWLGEPPRGAVYSKQPTASGFTGPPPPAGGYQPVDYKSPGDSEYSHPGLSGLPWGMDRPHSGSIVQPTPSTAGQPLAASGKFESFVSGEGEERSLDKGPMMHLLPRPNPQPAYIEVPTPSPAPATESDSPPGRHTVTFGQSEKAPAQTEKKSRISLSDYIQNEKSRKDAEGLYSVGGEVEEHTYVGGGKKRSAKETDTAEIEAPSSPAFQSWGYPIDDDEEDYARAPQQGYGYGPNDDDAAFIEVERTLVEHDSLNIIRNSVKTRSKTLPTRMKEIPDLDREEPQPEPSPSPEQDTEPEVPLKVKDLKAMGLAAGGKLVQDIYTDTQGSRTWNIPATRLLNIHILSPEDCESITHIVPQPPPASASQYADEGGQFFVVEEKPEGRLDAGDFADVKSVAGMDKQILSSSAGKKEEGEGAGEAEAEAEFDPTVPTPCRVCNVRLCDCIVRPCGEVFCNLCIRVAVEKESRRKDWKCPGCKGGIERVAGFSAPMNLPGEEHVRRAKVEVNVLRIGEEDGRVRFKSVQSTRM